MTIFKSICFLLITVFTTSAVYSQNNVVTDRFGTTFLTDVLPPSSPVRQNRGFFKKSVPSQVASIPTRNDQLIDRLCGVVLVTPNDIRPNGWSGIEGVWHDFENFPAEAGWAIQRYIGKPATLESLDRMVVDVLNAYRESDRPVVDVSLPEQDITSGVVQLVVIESNLARVQVQGTDVATEEYIRSQLRVKKGEVIKSSDVLHDLAWLNRSPHRKVDLVYQPGHVYGTTDAVLKVSEVDKPTKVTLGYDDSGTEFLGRDRLNAGINFGELGRPGRSLAYQYSTDVEFDRVRQHSVFYSHDLPWRHNFTLLASFVNISTQFPITPFIPVETDNFNWQLSGRYNIPLKSKEGHICEPLFGDFTRDRNFHFGFDFKSNQSDLEFGGFGFIIGNSQNTGVEIYQATVGYNEVWHHPRAISNLDVAAYYSPGGFSPHNSVGTFQQARAGSDPRYAYGRGSFEHQRHLIQNWSLRTKVTGQVASGNLQASEQLGAGGFDIGRGFDQRVIRGDQGLWGTAEVYTPEMSLARSLNWQDTVDSLRFLTFVDAAGVSNVDLLPGEPNSRSIASVGVGLRYNYNNCYDVRVDYGHPVMSDNIPNGDIDTTGRFHIGVTGTF